jgi:chorismate synthase
MLRFLTAGESHGPALIALLDGIPAGLPLQPDDLLPMMQRRQSGYGRGQRQQIERDQAQILSGVYGGRTIGAPIALLIPNRDYANWRERTVAPWRRPRPGHADLAGAIKYGLDDLRLVAERASARETAARVAAGAVAAHLLAQLGIAVGSYVRAIGPVDAALADLPLTERIRLALQSDVSCPDAEAAGRMRVAIDAAQQAGDSLGGIFDVVALGLPVGLGTHTQWDRRLDARLAAALMSIQAVKGVEIGPAFDNARLPGTAVHDALYATPAGPARRTNRAGGLEGGMTNGEPLLLSAAMKPIPTTLAPQPTVDLDTGQQVETEYQRSDGCAVPAAAVVGEAMVALTLAEAVIERCGGDTLAELQQRMGGAHVTA